MVINAGLGVAMGKSFLESKKIGNMITKSNDEDGFAEVIDGIAK